MDEFFLRLTTFLARNNTKEVMTEDVCRLVQDFMWGTLSAPTEGLAEFLLRFTMTMCNLHTPDEAWKIARDRDESGRPRIARVFTVISKGVFQIYVGGRISSINEYWDGDQLKWMRFYVKSIFRGDPLIRVDYYSSERVLFRSNKYAGLYMNGVFTFDLGCRIGGEPAVAHMRATADDVSVWYTRADTTVAGARNYQEA